MEDSPQENESRENSEISPVRPHSPAETREETGQMMASITRSVYRGPIPPPEILKGYDLVKPGNDAFEKFMSSSWHQNFDRSIKISETDT